MTPEERAEKLYDLTEGVFDPSTVKHVAAAIREAVEDALLDASGTLADIAFSADLDLQGVRNKARKCYERLTGVTPPAAGPAAAPSS